MPENLGEALIRIKITLKDNKAQKGLVEFFQKFTAQVAQVQKDLDDLNKVTNDGRLSFKASEKVLRGLTDQLVALATNLGQAKNMADEVDHALSDSLNISLESGTMLAERLNEAMRLSNFDEAAKKASAARKAIVDGFLDPAARAAGELQDVLKELDVTQRLKRGDNTVERPASVPVYRVEPSDKSFGLEGLTANKASFEFIQRMISAEEQRLLIIKERFRTELNGIKALNRATSKHKKFFENTPLPVVGAVSKKEIIAASKLQERLAEEHAPAAGLFGGSALGETDAPTATLDQMRQQINTFPIEKLREVMALGYDSALDPVIKERIALFAKIEKDLDPVIPLVDRFVTELKDAKTVLSGSELDDFAARKTDDLVAAAIRIKKAAGEVDAAGNLLAKTSFTGPNQGKQKEVDQLAVSRDRIQKRADSIERGTTAIGTGGSIKALEEYRQALADIQAAIETTAATEDDAASARIRAAEAFIGLKNSITPVDDAIETYHQKLDKLNKSKGDLSVEQYAAALKQLREEFVRTGRAAQKASGQLSKTAKAAEQRERISPQAKIDKAKMTFNKEKKTLDQRFALLTKNANAVRNYEAELKILKKTLDGVVKEQENLLKTDEELAQDKLNEELDERDKILKELEQTLININALQGRSAEELQSQTRIAKANAKAQLDAVDAKDPQHPAAQARRRRAQAAEEKLASIQRGTTLGTSAAAVATKQYSQDLKDLRLAADRGAISQADLARGTREANARLREATGVFSVFSKTAFRNTQIIKEVGFAVSDAGRQLTFFGIGLATSFVPAIQQAAQFQQSVQNVVAVLGQLSGTEGVVNALSDAFLRLGERTEFTANEIAEASRQLALAGFNSQEIRESIDSVIALASAGNVDPTMSANIFANILRAFKIDASNAGRVADVLSTVATQSNTTVEKLGNSFKLLAPIAANLGQSLEDVSTSLGILGDAGITASRAGTGLSRAFSELLEKSTDFDEVLQSIGSSFEAIDPTKVALGDIVAEFERLQTLGLINTATFFDLFDQRSARVVVTLVNQGAAAFEELSRSAEQSAGSAARIRAQRIDTLAGDFRILLSSLQTLLIEIGDSFLELTRDIIQSISSWVRALSRFIDKHPKLVNVLVQIAASFSALTVSAGGFLLVLGGLIRVFATVQQIMLFTNALRAATVVTDGLTASNVRLVMSLRNTNAAAWAFVKSFPGAVIAGIAASILLVVIAVNRLTASSEAFNKQVFLENVKDLDKANNALDRFSTRVRRLQKDIDLLKNLPSLNRLQLSELFEDGSLISTDRRALSEDIQDELQDSLNLATGAIRQKGNLLDAAAATKSVFTGKLSYFGGAQRLRIRLVLDEDSEDGQLLRQLYDPVTGANIRTVKIDVADLNPTAASFASNVKLLFELQKDLDKLEDPSDKLIRAFKGGRSGIRRVLGIEKREVAVLDNIIKRNEIRNKLVKDPDVRRANEAFIETQKAILAQKNGIIDALEAESHASDNNLNKSKELLIAQEAQRNVISKIQQLEELRSRAVTPQVEQRITEQLEGQAALLIRQQQNVSRLLDEKQEIADIEKKISEIVARRADLEEKAAEDLATLRKENFEAANKDTLAGALADFEEFKAEQLGTGSLQEALDALHTDIESLTAEQVDALLGEDSTLGLIDKLIITQVKQIEEAQKALDRLQKDGFAQVREAIEARLDDPNIKDTQLDVFAKQQADRLTKNLQQGQDQIDEFERQLEQTRAERADRETELLIKEKRLTDEFNAAQLKAEEDKLLLELEQRVELAKLLEHKEEQVKLEAEINKITRERAADQAVGTKEELAGDAAKLKKRDEFIERAKQIFELGQKTKEEKKEEKKLAKVVQDLADQQADKEKERLEVQKKLRDTLLGQAKSLQDVIALTKFLNRQDAIRLLAQDRIRKRVLAAARQLNKVEARQGASQRLKDERFSKLGLLIGQAKDIDVPNAALARGLESLNTFSPLDNRRAPGQAGKIPGGVLPVGAVQNNDNRQIKIQELTVTVQADTISSADDIVEVIKENSGEVAKAILGGVF